MIDIVTILSGKEKVTVEAKLATGGLPNSVWETYSSFANTFGGVILLGVEEIKETHELIPKGVSDPHQMVTNIWNTLNNPQKISNNILLDNHVYNVEHNGMNIVVIEVPRADRRDKPIYTGIDMFKGSFKRNSEGDYHCKKEEVLAMVRDQSEEGVDGKVIETLSISDLNAESIHRYRISFGNKKPNHVWTKLSDAEFLMRIGAAKKGEDRKVHPTLAGLLFFGDFMTIVDEVPNYFLDYRERLSNETRWSDRVCSGDGDWSGNVFDFYFKVIDRLTSDVKRPFKLDANLTRVDDTPIHAALREALANALIHADYYGRCGIVIDKEFRKITIANPGTFRISVDAAIAGGISDARNSRIFNMFSLIDVGERSGSGLCDLYNTWKEFGYKTPALLESVDPDRITLMLQIDIDANGGNRDGNGVNDGGNDGNNGGNGSIVDDPNWLLSSEFVVYETLKEQPTLTIAKLATETELSERTVQRAIKSLKEKGYIKREGSTRGKWIILK